MNHLRDGDPLDHLVLLVALKPQKVHQRAPLAVAGPLRDLIDPHPVDLPAVGKEENVIAVVGDEQMLGPILIPRGGAGEPHAAAVLRSEFGRGRPLDVVVLGDRDDHRVVGDALQIVAGAEGPQLRAALVGELLFDLLQVASHDREDIALVGEDAAVFGAVVQKGIVFAREFLLLEVNQLTERHLQNSVGLNRGEGVGLFAGTAVLDERLESGVPQGALKQRGGGLDLTQTLFRLGLGLAGSDDADHLVDIGVRDEEPLDRVKPFQRPVEEEGRPSADHAGPVTNELFEHLFEREDPRLIVDQRQQDDRVGGLQRGGTEQLI